MKKLISFLVLINSLAAFAHGGDKVGNGGDVIVCPGKRVELLDIFQGEDDWGFKPIKVNGSRLDTIKEVLRNFHNADPGIAWALRQRATELHKELSKLETDPSYGSSLVKLTDNVLLNISDEGVAELPQGCEIIQAATQVQSPFPREVKFTFQKDTWLSLEEDVQAALILHEVIYEHMISVGENSSRSTRYFNAALHANAITTVRDYFEISSLFGYRNLAIVDDGKVRYYGPKGKCSIQRKWFTYGESGRTGGTTIIVNGRNAVTNFEQHDWAMEQFWEKYVSRGLCD
ncbi:MAG: hypothetical protein ACLGHN_12225 [Bacteriovoracia bacterium]